MEEIEKKVEQPEIKEKSPKKKGKIILILVLLLIAVGIGLWVGFEKLNSNPRNIYKKAITETYELLDGYLKDNLNQEFKLNFANEPMNINTSFIVSSNNEDLNALSDYEIDLSLGLDIQKKKMNVSGNLNSDGKKIIGIMLSYLDNKAYLKSEELYDKVLDLGEAKLEIDISEMNNMNINYDNLHIILSELKNILIASLDENKLSIAEETIKIGSKNMKCKKATYLLDKENIKRTLNFISDKISENENLLAAISNVTGIDKEDIINSLKEEYELNDYEEMVINLYTNKNKLIAGNVMVQEEAIIRFTNEEQFDLIIGDEYTNLTLNHKDNTINLAYNEYDEEILSVTLQDKSESRKIEITTTNYGTKNKIYIEFTNIKQSKDEWNGDILINLEEESYGTTNNIELKGNLNIVKEEVIPLDITDSVDVNTLTEEEQSIIEQNLLKIFENFGISNSLNII